MGDRYVKYPEARLLMRRCNASDTRFGRPQSSATDQALKRGMSIRGSQSNLTKTAIKPFGNFSFRDGEDEVRYVSLILVLYAQNTHEGLTPVVAG